MRGRVLFYQKSTLPRSTPLLPLLVYFYAVYFYVAVG